MRLSSIRTPVLLASTGLAYLAAIALLVITRTPLGSGLFLACTALCSAAYVLMLTRVWNTRAPTGPLFFAMLALAVAYRLPPALSPVGSDSDMVRYIWDGRVQHLGYNPYAVVPADPALSHTHTDETIRMPSRRARTPYPPAAQLFFKLVTAVSESTLAMKLALLACDLLTIVVLWRWLAITGRSEWLVLAYAWNPLVVLEVAHSGHIDALGALWITVSAYWLTRRHTALATVAFVLAVATKLLPIVLTPLFVGRIRARDWMIGLGLAAGLYLPFAYGTTLPVGAVPNVVAHIRFNGPLFLAIASLASPTFAAAAAVLLGGGMAVWMRRRRPASDPAAWAWPMAVALACAPVIYPWYLMYLTPFLLSFATLPLTVWTLSSLPVYLVWHFSRHGGRWIVPGWVMAVEFGAVAAATALAAGWAARAPRRRESSAESAARLK